MKSPHVWLRPDVAQLKKKTKCILEGMEGTAGDRPGEGGTLQTKTEGISGGSETH